VTGTKASVRFAYRLEHPPQIGAVAIHEELNREIGRVGAILEEGLLLPFEFLPVFAGHEAIDRVLLPGVDKRSLVVDFEHRENRVAFEFEGVDQLLRIRDLQVDHTRIEDMERLALGGQAAAAGDGRHAVNIRAEFIADM
jgi:hypothetical protein